MRIVRPLTADGLVGLDEFGQTVLKTIEGDHETYMFVADVRDLTCPMCERGWEPTGPAIGDQTRWQVLGDGVHVHLSCLARFSGFQQREEVWSAICAARLRFRGLKAIPNGYWRSTDPWGRWQPWYSAELLEHPLTLTIGMRKRVWSIELRALGSHEISSHAEARAAFADEDVTKGFGPQSLHVHAWGDAKMREYVGKLATLLGAAAAGAQP